MLTGDENIIDIQFVVFWIINDAGKYLFHIRNPEETVKNAAEIAMREIIGKTAFEFARTQGRAKIEQRRPKLLQQILDRYGAGILVTQVETAARRSARLGHRGVPRRAGAPAPTRSARSTRLRPTTTK